MLGIWEGSRAVARFVRARVIRGTGSWGGGSVEKLLEICGGRHEAWEASAQCPVARGRPSSLRPALGAGACRVLYTQRAPPCVSIPGTRASVPFGSPSASYLDGHALASLLVRPWGGTRRTKSRAMGVRGADRTWTSCPVTLRLCLVGPCSRVSGAPPRAIE